MDVRSAPLYGLGEQRIDQAYHRLAELIHAGLLRLVFHFTRLDFVQDAVYREFKAVVLVNRAQDVRFAGELGDQAVFVLEQRAHLIERDDVVRVGDRQGQAVSDLIHRQGQQLITPRHIFGDQTQCGRVYDDGGEIYALLAEVFRQDVADSGFREKAKTNQQTAQRLVRLALLLQGNAQLVVADNALANQYLSQLLRRIVLLRICWHDDLVR